MKSSRNIIYLFLSFTFLLSAFSVNAQWQKWHFGGGVGSMTYHGDLSDRFVNANIQELGYHFFVERSLTKKTGFYWGIESINGHISGSDRAPGGWINKTSKNFDRALNFRTSIHDINTHFTYYFGNIKKRERAPFLNAYVRAGVGIGFFDVYGDLKDADGNLYNYWSDGTIRDIPESNPNTSASELVERDKKYETNLRKLETEKKYGKIKWQIPVGVGLKMRLSDAVSLVLDAQYTYAMTDYLDNVGDKEMNPNLIDPIAVFAADPNNFIGNNRRNLGKRKGVNDAYLYASVGLSFNVGTKQQAKFKAPIFYPKSSDALKKEAQKEEKVQKAKEEQKQENLDKERKKSDPKITSTDDQVDLKPEDNTRNINVYIFNMDKDDSKVVVTEDSVVVMNKHRAEKKTSTYIDSVKVDTAEVMLPDSVQVYVDSIVGSVNEGELRIADSTLTLLSAKDSVVVLPDTIIELEDVALDTLLNEIKDSLNAKIQEISENVIEQEPDSVSLDVVDSLTADSIQITVDSLHQVINDIYDEIEQQNLDSILTLEKRKIDTTQITFDVEPHELELIKDDTLKLMMLELKELKTIEPSVEADTLPLIELNPIDSSAYRRIDSLSLDFESKNLELNTRISELDALIKNYQDSIFQNTKTYNDSIENKLRVNFDTIQSQSSKIEYLKQKIEKLEKDTMVLKENIIQMDTAYIEVADTLEDNHEVRIDTVYKEIEKVDSNLYRQQNEIIDLLKRQLIELETIQIQRDSINTEIKTSTEEQKSKEAQSKEEEMSRNEESEKVKQRIAELEANIANRKWKEDSIRIVNEYIQNTDKRRAENTDNATQQKVVEDKLRSIETQLMLIQGSSNKTESATEKKLLEEQTKLNKLLQALIVAKGVSDIGNAVKKQKETSDNKNNLKEEVDKKGAPENKDTLKVSEEPKMDTLKTDSLIYRLDSTLINENKVLKEQVQSIQKAQDSLVLVLNNLVKANQQKAQAEQQAKEEQAKKLQSESEKRESAMTAIVNQPPVKVFFAVGKSSVATQYLKSLNNIAGQLKNYPELKLELKGFADPTGNITSNLKLSEKRAQSVKDYFQNTFQIGSDRIAVLPAGQEDNSTNLSYSRRVEVQIVK